MSETACIAENGARQIKSKFFEEKIKLEGGQGDERPRDDPSNASAGEWSVRVITAWHPPSRWLMRIRWIMDHHPLARITFYLHRARTSLALLLSHNKAFLTRGRFIGNGMKPKPKKKKKTRHELHLFFFFSFSSKRQTGQWIAVR